MFRSRVAAMIPRSTPRAYAYSVGNTSAMCRNLDESESDKEIKVYPDPAPVAKMKYCFVNPFAGP